MKKIVTILAVSALMTACNNSNEEKTDVSADTSNTESPLIDAINVRDSAGKVIEAAKDTAAKIIQDIKPVIKP